jgi:hypothetical protein
MQQQQQSKMYTRGALQALAGKNVTVWYKFRFNYLIGRLSRIIEGFFVRSSE